MKFIDQILKEHQSSPTSKIATVIGNPISQSLSPFLHNYWLKTNNIDGKYIALQIESDELKIFFEKLREMKEKFNFVGCNITIPHKEMALKFCDNLTESAKQIGAINTIYFNQNDEICGDNSDHFGFISNIKNSQPNFNFQGKKALVLGAGGASRAIIFGLLKEKTDEILISNHNQEKAKNLADNFNQINIWQKPKYQTIIKTINWENIGDNLQNIDLLINTTPLGMVGKEELKINLQNLNKSALVCDIVYKPLITNLLNSANKRNNPIINGIGMLIYQGQVGFKKWFKIKPKITQNLINQITTFI